MKKVNKKSALFLSSVSAALVASAVAPGTSVSAEDVFPDVPSDHPYHDVIHALAEAGVVTGYEDGTFQLYSSVTRAEAAVMMARILDLDMETGEDSTFSDVYEGDWYAASINALHEAGYISGMEDGTFQPKKRNDSW
ncbi:S-layer homology domain-containing protein [Halobacillus litoralis]|uniref:S-layer homology domain-containing protein n=1 Tax=Halobacillus litoralis TaxID=45668 RepID=UPI00273FF8FD|nr:S-layer homology domain-containing protein [Halobacillus litoralis]WLR49026.1 S-layer homology domain-containing protein [Halobacillus litoralis]